MPSIGPLMLASLSPLAYAILVPTAAIAGFVDSIAGGGGILTLPALLAAGLPPRFALGTNKLQSSFGSLSATLRFKRAGLLRLKGLWPALAFTAVGAAAGAAAASALSSSFLSYLIPALLVAIVVFLALQPRFGARAGVRRLSPLAFSACSGLALGFYDGFFGPGTGTFWAMAFVGLAGLDLREATASTKATNFASNIVSLAVFVASGSVLFPLGLAMGIAQALGAHAGSGLVLKRGAGLVRALLMGMSALIVVYIVLKYWVLA